MRSFILPFWLVAIFAMPQIALSQTKIIPNDGWVKIYFESIDKLTKRLGFKPLSLVKIKPGDLEVRIWSGFGIQGSDGTIIQRISNKWSAFSLDDPQGTRRTDGKIVPPNAKKAPENIDWAKIWEQMERAGIKTIKDNSEIPHCSAILDGIGWVVEIAEANYYRTYMLSNPQLDRSEDGDKLLGIVAILAKAFGGSSVFDPAKLPAGEETIVPSFASDALISGESLGLEYKIGVIPNQDSVIHIPSETILSEGTSLIFPQCSDSNLPPLLRYTMKNYPEGSVVLEIFIQPDGSVVAAKALSGPALPAMYSLKAALNWKFKPLIDGNKIRQTVFSIRYQKKLMPYPWIK
jgi:hypothetical protein